MSILVVAVWLYLALARGGFWFAGERDDRNASSVPAAWPAATVVIPARDEADSIAATIGSLLAQDYPGPFRIVLVDDQSRDDTRVIARRAAERAGPADRLTVIEGNSLPAGWTGKLWALDQGATCALADRPTDYLLLTDADIVHRPDVLKFLVARAERYGYVLTSQLAELLVLFAAGWPQLLGALAWLAMALTFQPTLRLYGRSRLWGAALPLIALVYVAFTIDSAYQHGRGRGGLWKGRAQAEAVRR